MRTDTLGNNRGMLSYGLVCGDIQLGTSNKYYNVHP